MYQILLELPAKDLVKTSVLSSRWRYLWKHVSRLEFSYADLAYHDLEEFFDRFLGFDKKSLICQFKLCFDDDDEFSIDTSSLEKWINVVLTRGLEHLVIDSFCVPDYMPIELPIGICTCETLVHLKLGYVNLEGFDSVSIPRLETMHLSSVLFSGDASIERLTSSSPALKTLEIENIQSVVEVLRVWSQTLISLSIKFCNYYLSDDGEKYGLVIDAPSLKYLCLEEDEFKTIVLNIVGSSTNMDIDVIFNRDLNLNDVSKIEVALGNFLVGISKVMDLTILCSTLEAIYAYSRLAPLPQFPKLTCLRLSFPSAVSESCQHF